MKKKNLKIIMMLKAITILHKKTEFNIFCIIYKFGSN